MSEEEVKALVEMKDMLKAENTKLKQKKKELYFLNMEQKKVIGMNKSEVQYWIKRYDIKYQQNKENYDKLKECEQQLQSYKDKEDKLKEYINTNSELIYSPEEDSDIASRNMSKEADSFKVKRRITFINLRTNDYLFSMTGICSIEVDGDSDLSVICKVGEDKYQKHFLHLTTETTYVVEQLDYSEVSKYDYEIVFKPQSIIPIKFDYQE